MNATPATDLVIHRFGTPGAPVAVLLHGLTEAGTTWPDLVARWGDRWELLGVDLRGHGESPRFTAGELTHAPEVMHADAVHVLDLQASPVVLMGHSLGGLVALWAALDRPDAVRALVLEDPAQPVAGRVPYPEFVRSNEEFLDEMTDPARRVAKVAAMHLETLWSEAEIDAWAACKPLVDRNYVREGLYFDDSEWESHFAALAVPTLVVVPPTSPMAPDMRRVRNPSVRKVVVPRSGHCVRRDQPDRFFGAVEEFLGGVPV